MQKADAFLRTLDRRHGDLRPRRGAAWYHLLARYAVGQLSYEQMLAAADTTRQARRDLLLRGHAPARATASPTTRTQLWQKVIDTRMFSFFEFDMASRYLRVGAPTAPAAPTTRTTLAPKRSDSRRHLALAPPRASDARDPRACPRPRATRLVEAARPARTVACRGDGRDLRRLQLPLARPAWPDRRRPLRSRRACRRPASGRPRRTPTAARAAGDRPRRPGRRARPASAIRISSSARSCRRRPPKRARSAARGTSRRSASRSANEWFATSVPRRRARVRVVEQPAPQRAQRRRHAASVPRRRRAARWCASGEPRGTASTGGVSQSRIVAASPSNPSAHEAPERIIARRRAAYDRVPSRHARRTSGTSSAHST